MTFQISQRGKEYLKTAEALLHAARTMTDGAIARQLETLADDYQRRAEKASNVDAAKALARSAPSAEREVLRMLLTEVSICRKPDAISRSTQLPRLERER